jgi:transcriptional regulator with XRE-family HTH domain
MHVRLAHNVATRPFMAAQRPKPVMGRPPLPVDEDTPGGRLRALRMGAKEGQAEAANRLGISRTVLSRYETNILPMPDPVVERAAQAYGVTPAFVRYGDTENRMIVVSGRVGAGAHVEAIEAPPWRYVEVPSTWSDAVALEVNGLSCYPIYEDRDVIIIRGQHRLEEAEFLGKMSVVETSDGLGLVKRVRRGSGPGLYTLESPNAPPIEDVALASARPVKAALKP